MALCVVVTGIDLFRDASPNVWVGILVNFTQSAGKVHLLSLFLDWVHPNLAVLSIQKCSEFMVAVISLSQNPASTAPSGADFHSSLECSAA